MRPNRQSWFGRLPILRKCFKSQHPISHEMRKIYHPRDGESNTLNEGMSASGTPSIQSVNSIKSPSMPSTILTLTTCTPRGDMNDNKLKVLLKKCTVTSISCDCTWLLKRLGKHTAISLSCGWVINEEERRIRWITCSNLTAWFDSWERELIDVGYSLNAEGNTAMAMQESIKNNTQDGTWMKMREKSQWEMWWELLFQKYNVDCWFVCLKALHVYCTFFFSTCIFPSQTNTNMSQSQPSSQQSTKHNNQENQKGLWVNSPSL